MNEKYPVMEIVKRKLKEMKKDLNWLEHQTGRSSRWYVGNPEIEKMEYQVLMKMSIALQFDFIADHRRFLGETGLPNETALIEETKKNMEAEKIIHIEMKLAASISALQKNYPKFLQVVKDAGDKMGIEIQ
ncbi:MAG: hypothetical protein EOP42_17040 [Sphingobacteriaceae bacterium]|nr:MAG: hypothetical protein EOP42_17040 [Sphingobacteriaceae bacterium]